MGETKQQKHHHFQKRHEAVAFLEIHMSLGSTQNYPPPCSEEQVFLLTSFTTGISYRLTIVSADYYDYQSKYLSCLYHFCSTNQHISIANGFLRDSSPFLGAHNAEDYNDKVLFLFVTWCLSVLSRLDLALSNKAAPA